MWEVYEVRMILLSETLCDPQNHGSLPWETW